MILNKMKIPNLSLLKIFLFSNLIFFLNLSTQTNAQFINEINFDKNFKILGADVISGYPVEGNLIIARTNPLNKVKVNNELIEIDQSGIFVIGFHRDEEKEILLTITEKKKKLETFLYPMKRKYKVQRIDGLKQTMVSPKKETLDKINADREKVLNARSKKVLLGDFTSGFNWPLKGKITGVYGSQRILNGVPKSPHYGIDIAVPIGTPVYAPASGVISLADDLYYSGLTVILNHGLNVNSTFLHLSEIKVSIGDKVNKGQLIGLSGNTGRSTGPHLDWRIDWDGKRLDAEMLAGPIKY